MIAGKRILLIVGGGIAAYKVLELVRLLKKRGAAVRCIVTRAAKEFVMPLSFASLSGDKVYDELFSLTDEAEMGHIELSRDADLLVVAPATADLLAKMVQGLANDLASTALLATDKKILAAPAMNVRMWLHPATRRNIAALKSDGVSFVGPDQGEMACGEYGPGRLAEPEAIVEAIERLLATGDTVLPLPAAPTAALTATWTLPDRSLTGRHVLVTSGPTRETIDPVRFLSNHSSGKQGHAIAAAAAAAGARVTLISGPVALPEPHGVDTIHVESAREMLAAVENHLPADAAIFCAAVADWRVAETASQKMKKSGDRTAPTLTLVENPDILATIAQAKTGRPALVVGFAAETENVVENAKAKRKKKGCDWIVANDVSNGEGVFGGERNTVHLVTADGVEAWPTLDKAEVARRLVERLAAQLEAGR